ncbi:unnamed protein product [Mytilus edulis]|uniref:Uncharacterized protein n=1 Tax=Mytilus edulis TaxID=6550 RepID=A0A8S3QHU4_MYTED|nr:unnamed protein product [Mytilus edulis]
MAFLIASLICVLLFHGLAQETNGSELPTQCTGRTSMFCYPVIPSFIQIYGWNLSNVERLYLYDVYGLKWSLQTLPSGLFNWATNVQYLYMSDVGLENLNCDIFQPLRNSLNTIEMQRNLFREFPSCALKNMNHLKSIDFSYQNIESVIINDIELDSLSKIEMRQNKIISFSISNINNNNDITIVLDNNKISYLNISGVNCIKHLQVIENQLAEINHDIFHNSHATLVYLELSYNALNDDVWNVLEGVTSLETLKLKQNRLQTVSPSVITRLSKLVHLDLSHNYIKLLTDVLLRSGKMKTVLFNSNKLVNFPPNLIHDKITFRDSYHCTLDISNNMLNNIQLNMPSTSARLTLNLGQNELTTIQFNTNDREIESLNISSNRLVTLPETLLKAKPLHHF